MHMPASRGSCGQTVTVGRMSPIVCGGEATHYVQIQPPHFRQHIPQTNPHSIPFPILQLRKLFQLEVTR